METSNQYAWSMNSEQKKKIDNRRKNERREDKHRKEVYKNERR